GYGSLDDYYCQWWTKAFFCRIREVDGAPQNCEVAAMSPTLVGPTRTTAQRESVSSTEESENRILGSNAYSHCQPVAIEIREAIRTTSMMDDCNARALIPLRKSSIAVLSPRPHSQGSSQQYCGELFSFGSRVLRLS